MTTQEQPKFDAAATTSDASLVSGLPLVRQRLMCCGDLQELLTTLYTITHEQIGVDGMAYQHEEAHFVWQTGLPGTHTAEYTLNTSNGCYGTLRMSRSFERFAEAELARFEKILATALSSLQYQWIQERARLAPRVSTQFSAPEDTLLSCLQAHCEASHKVTAPVALVLVEIRNLPRLRNTYGEELANQFHEHVAAHLQTRMQEFDSVYLVGSSQIAIVLNYASEQRMLLTQELLQILVNGKVFQIGDQETEVQLSLGTVRLESRDTPRKLLDRAQLALSLARQSRMDPTFVLRGKWANSAA